MYSGIFDSHAHYDDERFDPDRDEVIAALQNNGVCNVIDVGCDLETSQKAAALAQRHPFFYAAVGYHPHEAENFTEEDFSEITDMLRHPKVVALGEIGLDYHYDLSPRDIPVSYTHLETELQLIVCDAVFVGDFTHM